MKRSLLAAALVVGSILPFAATPAQAAKVAIDLKIVEVEIEVCWEVREGVTVCNVATAPVTLSV